MLFSVMSLLMHAVHTLQEKPLQKRTPNGGSEFRFTQYLKEQKDGRHDKTESRFGFWLTWVGVVSLRFLIRSQHSKLDGGLSSKEFILLLQRNPVMLPAPTMLGGGGVGPCEPVTLVLGEFNAFSFHWHLQLHVKTLPPCTYK